MNIAFVFFSHMGHTKKVAEVVTAKLKKDGHQVQFIELKPKAPLDLSAKLVEIDTLPDIRHFDALILGTPVHGGRISAPIRAFLNQLPKLQKMPTAFLLTQFFRKEWGAI